MRFLQPDLHPNDRNGIHRWNIPVAAVVHFFFTHYQNLSAQLSGIGAIAALHVVTSILMIRARPQYIAILHGKELYHE
jgi:hypothetical protein